MAAVAAAVPALVIGLAVDIDSSLAVVVALAVELVGVSVDGAAEGLDD